MNGRGIVHFEPLNPVVPGHILFVPAVHVQDASDSPEITGAVFEKAAQWASEHYMSYNLITNAGRAATQTVMHFHVHVIPRHVDDGLQLPWSRQRRDDGEKP